MDLNSAWSRAVYTRSCDCVRNSCGELSRARVILHAIFGTQFLLGLAAYWSRLTTVDAPQPMPVMVYLTVIHTVVGAILFAFSILIVLMCYRLIPRGGEVRAEAARQVGAG